MSEFANIPLDRITASLSNPRKHFNPTTLAVGVPVKIASELSNPRQQKYAGKSGTITGKVGSAWDVTFKGRTGGISSFTADQLTVVAA